VRLCGAYHLGDTEAVSEVVKWVVTVILLHGQLQRETQHMIQSDVIITTWEKREQHFILMVAE